MLFEKGYTPWNKGTKGVCKSSNTSFKKGMTPWNKGKRGIGGEAHYNWNGGITKISRRVYQMPEYTEMSPHTHRMGPYQKSILTFWRFPTNY